MVLPLFWDHFLECPKCPNIIPYKSADFRGQKSDYFHPLFQKVRRLFRALEYWLNLSITSLSTAAEERAWTIYQSPAIQFRNLETVPRGVSIFFGKLKNGQIFSPKFARFQGDLGIFRTPKSGSKIKTEIS